MDRLDYYDILPKGFDAYLASHGHHMSKPMLEWAVGMMRDRNGKKVQLVEKKQIDETLKTYGVELDPHVGYYDIIYLWCMVKADYYGSSITDDIRLAMFIRDYTSDPDGNPTKAFDHFITDCMAMGIDIPWANLL